jgi:hypothetical protein
MWEWRFDAFSGLRRALAVMQRSQMIGGSSGKPEGKLSVTPTIAGSEVLPWSCGEGAHLRLPAVARNVTCGNGVFARLLGSGTLCYEAMQPDAWQLFWQAGVHFLQGCSTVVLTDLWFCHGRTMTGRCKACAVRVFSVIAAHERLHTELADNFLKRNSGSLKRHGIP